MADAPELDLDEASAQLEDATPLEILRWAAGRFAPRLGFATGFGAEGCVLVDLVGRHGIAVDVFTLDTGVLFPETYGLWGRLEDRYGVTIRGVRPANPIDKLWETDPDACCQLRKVDPLGAEADKLDAWISAIRRDQTPDRADAKIVERDRRFGIVKINPLARWTSDDVWRHLRAFDVPYNPLHDRGYPSIGCAPCTSPVAAGEDPRSGRWRGSGKTECGLHLRVVAS